MFFQKIRPCRFNNFPIFLLQYKVPVFLAGLVSIFGLCYQSCLFFEQDTRDCFVCSLCLFPFKDIVMAAGISYVCFMVKIPVWPERSALDFYTDMIMLQNDNLNGLI